jgi:hypothetical protein
VSNAVLRILSVSSEYGNAVADFDAALKIHTGLSIAHLCRAICYHK